MKTLKPKIAPIGFTNGNGFNKLEHKRPAVVRKGDVVKKCFYWEGTHQCLGSQCYWPTVGHCPIFSRLKMRKAK